MGARATDWDAYYAKGYKTAGLTRRYTARTLVALLRRFAPPRPWIVELGGANSCFFDALDEALTPARYTVVDNNRKGLDLFRARVAGAPAVEVVEADLTATAPRFAADIAFSVGLVEHFDEAGTRRLVDAHFAAVRPGGIVLVSAPTPTFLYRIVRFGSERLGLWIFHDERPVPPRELEAGGADGSELLFAKTLWPQILTQHCVVWRAGAAAP
jgi:hypothetical protein